MLVTGAENIDLHWTGYILLAIYSYIWLLICLGYIASKVRDFAFQLLLDIVQSYPHWRLPFLLMTYIYFFLFLCQKKTASNSIQIWVCEGSFPIIVRDQAYSISIN